MNTMAFNNFRYVLAFLLIPFITACTETVHTATDPVCSNFDLDSRLHPSQDRLIGQVSFNPDTPECPIRCECDRIGFIQVVQALDPETGRPGDAMPLHMKQRRTSEGWAVDTESTKLNQASTWGYIGAEEGSALSFPKYTVAERNTCGKFDQETAHVYTGSSDGNRSEPAVLCLSPAGGMKRAANVIDVPVCLDEKSRCYKHQLGSFLWSYGADNRVGRTTALGSPASAPYQGIIDRAIENWNSQALDKSGNNSDQRSLPELKFWRAPSS